MKRFSRAALSAMLLAGAALFATSPARADVGFGISFGYDGGYFSDPCAYYDYYDQAPPWGMPPDYCDYPVYFEPVYWGGSWYRGPIYSRWYGGQRLYWLNGGWRRDEWRGARPSIRWADRGGWHGGRGWGQSGFGGRGYYDRGGRGGYGGYSGGHGWSGGQGGGNYGGGHGWSGGGQGGGNYGGGHGGGNYGGGHGWSGGGQGGGNYGGGHGGGGQGGGNYGGGHGGGGGGGGYGGGHGGGGGGGGHGGGSGGQGGGGGGHGGHH